MNRNLSKSTNAFVITIQKLITHPTIPSDATLKYWATTILNHRCKKGILNIRLVYKNEIEILNKQYHHQSGPINILSFPFEAPPGVGDNILGDLVLCPSILQEEAQDYGQPLEAYWAHLIIHGCLHLLGYHRGNEREVRRMETLAIDYLNRLGYSNPYS